MNKKQIKILEGLRYLGVDVAVFYEEGVNIYNGSSPLKAHFLAHCAREIDSAIRDTFSTDIDKKAVESIMKANREGDRAGLISSILASLGLNSKTDFANKWYETANKFHEIAHRNSKSKLPRVAVEGMSIWDDYEKILYELVGNYYSIKKLIDKSFKFSDLTSKTKDGKPRVHDLIDRLPSLFKISSIKHYFFLNLESEIWLNPLYNSGFFKPESVKNQFIINEFINIPNWIEGHYLIKIAKSNLNIKNREINQILTDIVNSYIQYKDKEGNAVNNSTSDLYISELIYLLPEDSLIEFKLNFIEEQLAKQSYLSDKVIEEYISILIDNNSIKLLEATIIKLVKPIAERIANDTSMLTDIDETIFFESFYNYKSLINEYSFRNLLNYLPKIREKLGEDILDKIINLVIYFHKLEPYLFNNYEIHTVNYLKEKYYHSSSPFKFLVQITFELIKCDLSNSSLLKKLINSNVNILVRISLELISYDFSNLKNIFLSSLDNIFNEIEITDDIKLLLNENYLQFSENEINYLIQQIDSELLKNSWQSESINPEDIKEFRAPVIISFLKIFIDKDFANGFLEKWSRELPKITTNKSENHTLEIIEEIPSFEDFQVSDVFKYLSKNSSTSYNENSIINRLKEDIQNNSGKYLNNITSFVNIMPIYRYEFLNTIKLMSYSNTFIYWHELIDYVNQIIRTKDFFKEEDSFNYLFIVEFCNLFIRKTEDDNNAIDIELTPDLINIYKYILDFIKPELKTIKDIQFKRSSTRYFCVLNGLFTANLRWARNKLKEEKTRFYNDIKEVFDDLLLNHKSIEIHYLLGACFPNLSYLDFEWYLNKISQIFPEDELYWYSSFHSYLIFHPVVSVDIYNRILKEYIRAITSPSIIKNSEAVTSLVEHIGMYYLYFHKIDEDESLAEQLAQTSDFELLKIFIRHLSRERFSYLSNNDSKFRNIWRRIYNRINSAKDSEEKNYVLGSLGNWVKQLTTLDAEVISWLETSFKNEQGLNTLELFNSLLIHIEVDPINVGQILIVYSNCIKEHKNHIYGIEKLTLLVGTLYSKGYAEVADNICNTLGIKGYNDFEGIYTLNHKH